MQSSKFLHKNKESHVWSDMRVSTEALPLKVHVLKRMDSCHRLPL